MSSNLQTVPGLSAVTDEALYAAGLTLLRLAGEDREGLREALIICGIKPEPGPVPLRRSAFEDHHAFTCERCGRTGAVGFVQDGAEVRCGGQSSCARRVREASP